MREILAVGIAGDAATLARDVLAAGGYTLREAPDAADPLAEAGTNGCDLVFLGVAAADRPTLVRSIKAIGRARPYILIETPSASDESVNEALSLGGDDCLSRPWTPAQLAFRVVVANQRVALRRQLERWRSMVEAAVTASRQMLFDWDVDRDAFEWTGDVEGVTGRPAAALKSTADWLAIVHPDDRERVRVEFEGGCAASDPHRMSYRIVTPLGAEVLLSSAATSYSDTTTKCTKTVGLIGDITEARRTQDERLKLQAQIQHAQRLESLGILAGGIAHDFNNLLMGVLGNADLALREISPLSPARAYLDAIRTAGLRASELTRQMLAYSGKGRFVVEPLDLNELIEEMAHLLQVSISKKVVLKFNFGDHLPLIEADASQIRQVIMNLITNASEAIGDRSGVISISTGVVDANSDYLTETYFHEDLAEGYYVYVEVSDTGSGMNEETRLKIFEPFFTTKFTGRGLGLAAVLGIMRGHKGGIRVYSELGKGTTFKLLFPAAHTARLAAEAPADTAPAAEITGKTVLVVDDEESVRGVVKMMLETEGCRVMTASDGREALDTFAAHRDEILLVFLDMTMPHLGGEETFRGLRLLKPDVKVLLSSGYNEQDATNRFAGKGLAGFIQKPFVRQVLLDKIRAILRS